jgi:Holliday junction resolvase RusA-like endonuclease
MNTPIASFGFSVPMPPSVNAMFATDFKTKRRFISKAYAQWLKDAKDTTHSAWKRQGSPTFTSPLAVTIHLGLNYQSDIDNRIKPLLDMLGKAIPDFPNDRYINRLDVERIRELTGANVLVRQMAA